MNFSMFFFLFSLCAQATEGDALAQKQEQNNAGQSGGLSGLYNQVSNSRRDLNFEVQKSRTMDQNKLNQSTDKQQNAEANTAIANMQGREQANKLGNKQTSLGNALVAAGLATPCTPCPSGACPPCAPIIAAGMFQKGEGQKSYAAARWMNQTGLTADQYKNHLDTIDLNAAALTDPNSISVEDAGASSAIDFSTYKGSALGNIIDHAKGLAGSNFETYGNMSLEEIKKKFPNVSSSMWESAFKQAGAAMGNPSGTEAKALFGKDTKLFSLTEAATGEIGSLYPNPNGEGKEAGSSDFSLFSFGETKDREDNHTGMSNFGLAEEAGSQSREKDALSKNSRSPASRYYTEKTIFQIISEQYKKRPDMIGESYFIRNKIKEEPKDIRSALIRGQGKL